MHKNIKEKIDGILSSNKIVLFMKGSQIFPRCGFSAKAVGILNELKVGFKSIDVLEDLQIRDGIKEYGNWPTVPQLYVNKELIGGSDIMIEMYESGELKNLLDKEYKI